MHFCRLPFNDQLNPQVNLSDSWILSTLQMQESPSDPEGISTEFECRDSCQVQLYHLIGCLPDPLVISAPEFFRSCRFTTSGPVI